MNNAIVLLSGGLDSCTILAMAKAEGLKPYALTFRYGQRHEVEIEAARKVAKAASVAEHRIIDIDLRQMGKSALTDSIDVPKGRSFEEMEDGIPVTYVPARNTIFLSFALGWAEVIGAWDIFIGVNAGDYAGYPDCRREYIAAFEQLANLATKAAIEGTGRYQIHTPIIEMTKAQIIAKGHAMGVDFGLTSSCYDPSPAGIACGLCDACLLRRKGFEENNTVDPAPYQNIPEP